jgi:hypothetical protein
MTNQYQQIPKKPGMFNVPAQEQSKPPLGKGFRGFDRERQGLGLHRLGTAPCQEVGLTNTQFYTYIPTFPIKIRTLRLIFGRGCQTTSRVRASPGVDRARGGAARHSGHDRLSAKRLMSFRPKGPIHRAFFQQAAWKELPSTFADGG